MSGCVGIRTGEELDVLGTDAVFLNSFGLRCVQPVGVAPEDTEGYNTETHNKLLMKKEKKNLFYYLT